MRVDVQSTEIAWSNASLLSVYFLSFFQIHPKLDELEQRVNNASQNVHRMRAELPSVQQQYKENAAEMVVTESLVQTAQNQSGEAKKVK